MQIIRNVYTYREMVASLVKRDLRGRYRGSVLGFLWTFLNPLFQLVVYTIVFSTIMRSGISDYYLFLFVALIPWMMFGTSLNEGSACIWNQAGLVSKVYFPREILPISYVTSQFVNMLLSFIVIFIVLVVSGKGIAFSLLIYLPIIMIAEYLLSLGFVFMLSGITVYFRDVQFIMGIISMAWQFLTPVMYSLDMVPEELRVIFSLNPMTPIIEAYRNILYYKQEPDIKLIIQSMVVGLIVLIIGIVAFKKLEKHFAENM